MDVVLLGLLGDHVLLDLLLFELEAASSLVDLHVQHLLGGFTFTFDNLQLLPMVADFSDYVDDFVLHVFDGTSQREARRVQGADLVVDVGVTRFVGSTVDGVLPCFGKGIWKP